MLLNLVRPKYFVPIHGEYRHLVLHAKLAEQCCLPPENIFVMETGDVLEIGSDGAKVVDHVVDGHVFVDGRGVGDVQQNVLDDRRALALNGFVVAVIVLDKYTGGLVGDPQIVTRGFVSSAEAGALLEHAKEAISKVVASGGTRNEVVDRIRTHLGRLVHETTGRRPMIIPVVTKV